MFHRFKNNTKSPSFSTRKPLKIDSLIEKIERKIKLLKEQRTCIDQFNVLQKGWIPMLR